MAALAQGGILGVAQAPLLNAPLNVLHQDNRVSNSPYGSFGVTPVSEGAASPLPAPGSSSLALLERLSPEQCASFLRFWARLPLHLRGVTFDIHGTDWAPEAIQQLGDVPCEFPGF